MDERTCSFDGCEKRHYAKKWCRLHYGRWKRHGDPAIARRSRVDELTITDEESWCSMGKHMVKLHMFAKNQKTCRECRKVYSANNYSQGKTCAKCGVAVVNHSTGHCLPCSHIARRGKHIKNVDGYRNHYGYIVLPGQWDHPNSNYRGHILEHVKVMSEILNRPLVKGENVHHKNGVRDDNRPENLELWVISQPPGQRPEDLVAWAREIINRYG